MLLDGLTFFGPVKAREMYRQGLTPADVIQDPARLEVGGSRVGSFRAALAAIDERAWSEARKDAEEQLKRAASLGGEILLHSSSAYPPTLFASNYPVPILYVRGAADVLGVAAAVACVGSRGIREPFASLHDEFTRTACSDGLVIVSGFALGADTVGHTAAVRSGGQTIAVLAGGLDRPFPPENRPLWEEMLAYRGAVFVSESPFGARTSSMTLRRRNKLIVALSQGVLVSQSAADGGAMNAWRFAQDDHKPAATFEGDGELDTSGNALIGAHPEGTVFPRIADPAGFRAWLRALD